MVECQCDVVGCGWYYNAYLPKVRACVTLCVLSNGCKFTAGATHFRIRAGRLLDAVYMSAPSLIGYWILIYSQRQCKELFLSTCKERIKSARY